MTRLPFMARLIASGILISFLIFLYLIFQLSGWLFLLISVFSFAIFEFAIFVFYNRKDQ